MRVNSRRRIGIDLDNTLACYNRLFGEEARRLGLIPEGADLPDKLQVRAALQNRGRNDLWTKLQGEVYGPNMTRAPVFPGALDFVRQALRRGHEVKILSHRSRRPALGENHDLWAAALRWLGRSGFLRPEGPLERKAVHLAPSREEKIRMMIRLGCTDFIDDLPEVLGHPLFPRTIRAHLFDPGRSHGAGPWCPAFSWFQLRERILW